MENNGESPIEDYSKVSFKKIYRICIIAIVLIHIINVFLSFGIEIAQKKKEEEIQKELARITIEMNSKINYVIDFEDEHFDTDALNEIEYIEYDNGIKIPTLSIYKSYISIDSFSKKIEDNIVANDSPVINIIYNNSSSFLIEKFKAEILKKENYKQIQSSNANKKVVYIREELDNYFSYIIIEECVIAYGVSFGEPNVNY